MARNRFSPGRDDSRKGRSRSFSGKRKPGADSGGKESGDRRSEKPGFRKSRPEGPDVRRSSQGSPRGEYRGKPSFRKSGDEDKRPGRPYGGPAGARGYGKPSFKKRDEGGTGGYRRDQRSEGGERRESRPWKKEGDRNRSYGDRGKDFRAGSKPRPYGERKEGRDFGDKPRGEGGFRERGGKGGRDFGRDKERGEGRYQKRGKSFEGDSAKEKVKGFDEAGTDKNERGAHRPERKSFVESRLDRQRQSFKEKPREQEGPKDELIRLNRFISNSGVCSRREADDLIAMGLVSVNGKTITEMGYKVRPTDEVRYEGKRLKAEKPVYILLNKPKGYITTTDDPQERNTVMNLIEGACKERVYPVGRLDRNTSGLLLLTNDGDLTEKLSHPSYNVKKIYKAELDRPLTKNDFQKILDGVFLEEGKAVVDDLAIVSDDGKTVGLEIHIGWNRIVRRIFEALGYEVVKLDRSVYATLDKKDLPRGHWRFLRQDEVVRLKHFL